MEEIKINKSINLNVNKPKMNKPVQKSRSKFNKSVDDLKKQVTLALNKVGGKYVKFDDIEHTEGLMVAGIVDESLIDKSTDVCFAIMNRDKKIVYVNNDIHFTVLQNIPSSLYVLNYLNNHEPETLYDYAQIAFEKDKVNLFTKIYIKKSKIKNSKNNIK